MDKIGIVVIFLGIFALFHVEASKEVDDYFDTILSVYLPGNLIGEKFDPLKLSDFSYHFQNRTLDGSIINGRVIYTSGNLTGLGFVERNATCGSHRWMFGNVTLNCTLVLRRIQANYIAKIKYEQTTYEVPLKVMVNVTNTYAEVMVTDSPYMNIPYLKALRMIRMGDIDVKYIGISKFHYNTLESRFREKFAPSFHQDVLLGTFKNVLAESFEELGFPLLE